MKFKGPVVVIDDDEDDREMMTEALEQLGVTSQVRMFENGRQALDYLKSSEENPFIIVCDINMPLMNGFELRERIAEDDKLRNKSIPFVFLTTSSLEEQIEQAYALAAHGYFIKPVSSSDTRETFRNMFTYWSESRTPLISSN